MPGSHPNRSISLQTILLITLLVIGISLLISILRPLAQEPAWLTTFSTIVTLVIIIIPIFVSLVKGNSSDTKNYYPQISGELENQNQEFPYQVVQSVTELLNILLPDPSGDIPLSDRSVPYVDRDISELNHSFYETGRVLLRGRSKTGKTRAVIELLRGYMRTTPTILLLKPNAELQNLSFTPKDLPRRNIVLLMDDLHSQVIYCRRRKINLDDVISQNLEFLIEYCGNQRSEVRFVAIVRKEPECWEQIEYHSTKTPWSEFRLVDIPELSTPEAHHLIIELANIAPQLKITPETVQKLASTNDGTFYHIVLKFREWREKPGKTEILDQDVTDLQADLSSAWKKRRSDLYFHRSQLRYIYAALDFTRLLGIPAEKEIVISLADSLQENISLEFLGRVVFYLNQILNVFPNQLPLLRNISKSTNKWIRKYFAKVSMHLYAFVTRISQFPVFTNHQKFLWLKLWPRLRFIALITPLLILLILYIMLAILAARNRAFMQFSVYIATWIIALAGSVTILFLGNQLLKFFLKLHGRGLKKALTFISSSEIPSIQNMLIPYDMQVEGALNEFFSQRWIKELLDSKNAINKNYVLFILLYYTFHEQKSNVFAKEVLIRYEPKNFKRYLSLAEAYYNQGRYTEALDVLKESIRLQPDEVQNYYWSGITNFQLNNYSNALIDFSQAINLLPENAYYHFWRGFIHYNISDYTNALVDFNHTIELWPNDSHYYYWRGCTLLALEKKQAAIVDFDRAIEFRPQDEQYYNIRGQVHILSGNYSAAFADFNQAIDLMPDKVNNYFWRGIASFESSNYSAALADFKRAVEFQPENDNFYFWRGRAYFELQDYSNAIVDFSRMIELQPKNGSGYYWRGRAYAKTKDYSAALTDFNRTIEVQPEESNNYYWRAYPYFKLKNYHAAIEDINQAIKFNLDNADYYFSRGLINLKLKDYLSALADFNQALSLRPDEDYFYANRGLVKANLGCKDEAVTDLLKIMQLSDGDATLSLTTALGFAILNNFENASKMLRRALEQDVSLVEEEMKDPESEYMLLFNNPECQTEIVRFKSGRDSSTV